MRKFMSGLAMAVGFTLAAFAYWGLLWLSAAAGAM